MGVRLISTCVFRSLFPCGDTMVCIIDDREDVWNFASNLVHVKPYQFFKGVGDINAPPSGSPKEENTSPGEPTNVPETQEGDIKPEELNSQEYSEDFKEELEKSDTVFEENVISEETESKAVREEKADLPNTDKNAEACKNNTKPIVEKCKDNSNMKTVVETVEPSEISSKVLENGGSDDVNDVTDKKELIETCERLNENNKDTEKNNNGKAESSEEQEQKTSDCGDNTTDETAQQRGEGGKIYLWLAYAKIILNK